ncbi:TPA: hypothetical protein EYO57_35020, partial [Candidatus Poribacteria bacterium]|nr:hypothetical protein [Candidatus Poribacteria bacterium]
SYTTHIPVLQARGIRVEYTKPPTNIVVFKDANLEKAIRDALGIPTELLKKEDLAGLVELNYDGKAGDKITNLTGLEHCVNLLYLYLSNNQISDISVLSSLKKLRIFDFGNSPINDISALSNLTKLTDIRLWFCKITDITPLTGLTNLTAINFTENKLNNINPLTNLTNLNTLKLAHNQLSDVSPLANLTNLTRLEFNDNQISNIKPLVENTGISGEINLTNNLLNNISLTSHIPALKARGITVEHDEVPADIIKMSNSDFEASLRKGLNIPTETITVSNTSTISDLNLVNTGVVDLDVEALKALPKLKSINLTNNPLSKDAILVQIPELEFSGIKVDLGTSAAARVKLSAEKTELPASLASTTDITVTVADASGKPVKRETVDLTVDKGTIQSPAANNGDGTYTATYAATDV